jgi:hypothetical protein
MAIDITERELQRERIEAEGKLNSVTFNIRKKLRDNCKDKNLENQIYSILADSLSIQTATRNRLTSELSAAYADEFSLIFSSYVSAEMGLDRLISLNGSTDVKVRSFNYFDDNHINFQQLYPRPLNDMLLALSDAFDYPSRDGVLGTVENYFQWVKNETTAAKDNERYAKFHKKVQTDGVTVANRTFRNFDVMGLASQRADNPNMTWDYIGGYDDVKAYFKDMALLIKGIDHCHQCKDYIPLEERLIKGTLLVGPPNTGKTTVIEIFCNQAGIPYDMFSVADVGSKYVFETSRNIKAKFEAAGRQVKQGIAPAYLIYMMEIDAIAKKRYDARSSGEGDNAVAELNIHMRGPKAVPGVIVVADTNRPDALDSAIVSAGRFTRIIHMPHPDSEGVEKVLKALVSRGENYSNDTQVFGQLDYNALVKKFDNTAYRKNTGYESLIQKTVVGGYTAGDLVEIVSDTKRRMLLDHLKDNTPLRTITTKDVLHSTEIYDKGRFGRM